MNVKNKDMFNKKNIFKIAIVLMVLIFAISVGFNVKTELGNWKDKIKQEGVSTGQNQINAQIIQNLQQFGKLQINIPIDANQDGKIDEGEIKTIILIPQQ